MLKGSVGSLPADLAVNVLYLPHVIHFWASMLAVCSGRGV